MNELLDANNTMTSLQIAEITGKPHNDVLKAIRSMEGAWVKVNGGNFSLVEYKDAKGEMRPMYALTKTECLYVATKFNDEARAKLVIRWEELERERQAGGFRVPQNLAEALRLAADQAERAEAQQRQIEAMKPKALFADAVATSDRSCLVAELAKILQQNGVNIGQNRLFAWLREHCADYGFILRYPLGKESVTGVTYEPWHYRYVGEEAARAIMDAQLTLEEYLQQQGASNA